MESQYHHFGQDDGQSVRGEHNISTQTVFSGMKRMGMYILYIILVLLLLILLMVTGIKFSQINREITEVKVYLQTIRNNGKAPLSPLSPTGKKEISQYFQPSQTVCTFLYPHKTRGRCRAGWVSFQGSCYLLSLTSITWSKAEAQCVSQRGHLLVVNGAEELDFISKIVEIRYNYWIGLVERHNEGQWSWVDGTDFHSTPTFWDKGQPDNWDYRENGEDCGQIHASAIRKRKLWNDADCNLVYRYICEAKA
ncbi:hepatic lectin-like [Cololabis saira]|uniref:hepatic lectin-like n=1 Tax=Cololabis saira TaxID=129043 RepID=UPI002AD358FE|nr:hepatic lectin-like [Cololabis saira]